MRVEWGFWPYSGFALAALALWLLAGLIAGPGWRRAVWIAGLSLLSPALVPAHGEFVLVPAAHLLLVPAGYAKALAASCMVVFAGLLAAIPARWWPVAR